MRRIVLMALVAVVAVMGGMAMTPCRVAAETFVKDIGSLVVYVDIKAGEGTVQDPDGSFGGLGTYAGKKTYFDVWLDVVNPGDTKNVDIYMGLLTPDFEKASGGFYTFQQRNLFLYQYDPSTFKTCSLLEWMEFGTYDYLTDTYDGHIEPVVPPSHRITPACPGVIPFYSNLTLPAGFDTLDIPGNTGGYVKIGRFFQTEEDAKDYGEFPNGKYTFYFIVTEAGTDTVLQWIEKPFCWWSMWSVCFG